MRFHVSFHFLLRFLQADPLKPGRRRGKILIDQILFDLLLQRFARLITAHGGNTHFGRTFRTPLTEALMKFFLASL
jgi:hypothetical protein